MRLFPVAILILFLILTSNYESLAPFNSTKEQYELRNYWWTIFGYNFAEPTKVRNFFFEFTKTSTNFFKFSPVYNVQLVPVNLLPIDSASTFHLDGISKQKIWKVCKSFCDFYWSIQKVSIRCWYVSSFF